MTMWDWLRMEKPETSSYSWCLTSYYNWLKMAARRALEWIRMFEGPAGSLNMKYQTCPIVSTNYSSYLWAAMKYMWCGVLPIMVEVGNGGQWEDKITRNSTSFWAINITTRSVIYSRKGRLITHTWYQHQYTTRNCCNGIDIVYRPHTQKLRMYAEK